VLQAITAVGFLAAPEVLRLLPETALVMGALVLDDLHRPFDRRRREPTALPVAVVRAPVPVRLRYCAQAVSTA
jgi:hypothetical protein